ncbi:FG-GAP repeat protein [Stieleria maiorica]|uniref:FG-GAP repeat protein n=1 Tax=Stieleria maiorica TaxID=2795974 RepID=A0A5B9M9Q6_9BACT|nr:VCBS repeat-containing protein [Stieleria maiorica]QEF97269.1 FG-GAP repeat protein [Stieleria maiorica]
MKIALLSLLCMIPVFVHAELVDPVRLVDEDLPHAAPTMADLDGDGVRDLVVGLYRDDPYTGARFKWFRNRGSNQLPVYRASDWLRADGSDARVDEFCFTGAGPQIVDFDSDGLPDLVSGSKDGRLNVFPGLVDGSFGSPVQLTYAVGPFANRLRHNVRLFLFDWDGDGDQDLLATRMTTVWIIPNEGSPRQPRFGLPVVLMTPAGGEESFSSSVTADWDGDGRSDLVVGRWDGSIAWYRNIGEDDTDVPLQRQMLAPAKELVAPGMPRLIQIDSEQEDFRPDRPAGHVRIAVMDYDMDGDLDLLVGDAWASQVSKSNQAKLSDADVERRRDALALERELSRDLDHLQRSVDGEDDEVKAIRMKELDHLRSRCALAWRAAHGNRSHRRHGTVWFFERR